MGIAHKLIEALISAVEHVGEDGAGKDGIVGYLMKTGELNPDVIVEILVGNLPYQNPSAEDPSKDQGQVRKEERDLHRRR